MNEDIVDTMVRTAMEAIRNSYIINDDIEVGACVLADDGTLYSGCTINHSIAKLSLTAEIVAMSKAISDGKRHFDGIAIIADVEGFYIPDESSRQFLEEFNVPEIVLADFDGNVEIVKLDQLSPYKQRRRRRSSSSDKIIINIEENN